MRFGRSSTIHHSPCRDSCCFASERGAACSGVSLGGGTTAFARIEYEARGFGVAQHPLKHNLG